MNEFLERFLLVLTILGMLMVLVKLLKKYLSPRTMTYANLKDGALEMALFIYGGIIYFLGSFFITILSFILEEQIDMVGIVVTAIMCIAMTFFIILI